PGQQAYVEPAITELIKENILRPQGEKYFLTKTGFNLIYPPLNDFVKDTVLTWFGKNHAKEGDTLDVYALYLKHTLNWTPKQNSAFESGLKKMASEGLIEIKNGSVTLTKHGFEARNKSVCVSSHS
ncbi:hypothetical protein ACO0LF_31690, partial [Undibacterium sp. Di27W]|uniref:hypothetical protein n=1 Tax=Undibacterium sp. Di27W TaxID=3413036 RepID=UPI003BF1094D